jgi:hypothetical protein
MPWHDRSLPRPNSLSLPSAIGLHLGLELHDRRDRPERLFLEDDHAGLHARQYGGLEGSVTQRLAAGLDLAALGKHVVDMLLRLGDGGLVDQRSDQRVLLFAVADLRLAHRPDRLRDECVVDGGLHVEPIGTH